jgi:signal peptidase I
MTSEKKDLIQDGTPQTSNPWWLRLWHSQRENLQIVAIALLLAVVIRGLIAEPRFIPSDSMFPTLHIGDRLVVEKISYHLHPPTRGDIVVFEPPPLLKEQGFTKEQVFIKRIIGQPGQNLTIKEGRVYINNQPLSENYINEPPDYELGEVQIPENHFFVMGDNRNNSNDSHIWGFLPQENIIGRATFRFWPFDRVGAL